MSVRLVGLTGFVIHSIICQEIVLCLGIFWRCARLGIRIYWSWKGLFNVQSNLLTNWRHDRLYSLGVNELVHPSVSVSSYSGTLGQSAADQTRRGLIHGLPFEFSSWKKIVRLPGFPQQTLFLPIVPADHQVCPQIFLRNGVVRDI